MYAWQFAKMLCTSPIAHGWTRFVSMQNHYNLVYREEEREMMPLCREEGIGVIPWSPLARGFLAGNRRAARTSGDTARAQDRRLRARAVLRRRRLRRRRSRSSRSRTGAGVTPAQVALAWLLHQPGVTAPIVGASKMPQLEEAIAALDDHAHRRRDAGARSAVPAARGQLVTKSDCDKIV